MSECDRIQPLIEDLLADQLAAADRARLDQHLAACSECRALVELHQQLDQLGDPAALPSQAAFRRMRSSVLAMTVAQPRPQPARAAGRWSVSAVALATAATLMIGIFVGRSTVSPALDEELLLNSVMRQASASRELGDLWSQPLSYANVSAGVVRNGRIHLDFDVCSRLDVTTPLNSPLASELLSQAVLESASVGERLRAIELAAAGNDPRLIEALAITLEHDPDVAVRIEALNALSKQSGQPQVQRTLLNVLRDDRSVQIRLMALDQLAAQKVAFDQLQQMIVQGDQESNPAVLQRALQLDNGEKPADWL